MLQRISKQHSSRKQMSDRCPSSWLLPQFSFAWHWLAQIWANERQINENRWSIMQSDRHLYYYACFSFGRFCMIAETTEKYPHEIFEGLHCKLSEIPLVPECIDQVDQYISTGEPKFPECQYSTHKRKFAFDDAFKRNRLQKNEKCLPRVPCSSTRGRWPLPRVPFPDTRGRVSSPSVTRKHSEKYFLFFCSILFVMPCHII
jgi:hypothetical protein